MNDKQRKHQERLDFINSLPLPIECTKAIAERKEVAKRMPDVPIQRTYAYKPNSGYLYVIHCIDTKQYKIGQSINPENRMKAMQTGIPYELEIEFAIKVRDMQESERIIHEQYQANKIRGEWYELNDNELESVKEDMAILKDYDYSQSRPSSMHCEV